MPVVDLETTAEGRAYYAKNSGVANDVTVRMLCRDIDRLLIGNDAEAAVRKEREAIARMLDAEADNHDGAAEEALLEGEDGEASTHEADAAMLRSFAKRIRARGNPPVAEPEQAEIPEDDIAF